MSSVTIYTTPWCSYCKMAKEFFTKHSVIYTEKDVSTDIAARNTMLERSGQMGVPVIDIDGAMVVGFDQRRLKELLHID